jgi:hypothetical protein
MEEKKMEKFANFSVWRIRDVYPGSDFFPSRIRTVSIPDPGSSSKNLSILTPKKAKKWFLSSKKYDPGCSSRIPDPDADFLPSRIQGSKRRPIPGSRIRIRNTDFFLPQRSLSRKLGNPTSKFLKLCLNSDSM